MILMVLGVVSLQRSWYHLPSGLDSDNNNITPDSQPQQYHFCFFKTWNPNLISTKIKMKINLETTELRVTKAES